MAELTIGRMAKLYNLHRSSLYEAVAKGRVSAGLNANGQKVIDTSEMIRAYGPMPSNARHPTPPSQTAKTTPDSSALLEEIRKQTAVIEKMADRIERLEAALLRLPPPSTPEAPKQRPQTTPEPQAGNQPPKDLSAVLARFEARTRKG